MSMWVVVYFEHVHNLLGKISTCQILDENPVNIKEPHRGLNDFKSRIFNQFILV